MDEGLAERGRLGRAIGGRSGKAWAGGAGPSWGKLIGGGSGGSGGAAGGWSSDPEGGGDDRGSGRAGLARAQRSHRKEAHTNSLNIHHTNSATASLARPPSFPISPFRITHTYHSRPAVEAEVSTWVWPCVPE